MHPNPTHLPIPSFLPSALATSQTKEKKKIPLWQLQFLCVPQYSLLSTLLHFQISLQWVIGLDQDFCYTINTGSSLGLLSDMVLFPSVVEILQLGSVGQALHMLQQFIHGVDVGIGQLKTLDLGLGGSWACQPTSCPEPTLAEWPVQHCSSCLA